MTDLMLGAAMPNAEPRPSYDGMRLESGRSFRCDLVFGAVLVEPAPGRPPENWLYRRLRMASESVLGWPKERQADINYVHPPRSDE